MNQWSLASMCLHLLAKKLVLAIVLQQLCDSCRYWLSLALYTLHIQGRRQSYLSLLLFYTLGFEHLKIKLTFVLDEAFIHFLNCFVYILLFRHNTLLLLFQAPFFTYFICQKTPLYTLLWYFGENDRNWMLLHTFFFLGIRSKWVKTLSDNKCFPMLNSSFSNGVQSIHTQLSIFLWEFVDLSIQRALLFPSNYTWSKDTHKLPPLSNLFSFISLRFCNYSFFFYMAGS